MPAETGAIATLEHTPAPSLVVRMFTKNNCAICRATTDEFDRKGVPYEYINVEEDTAPRDDFDGLTPFDYVVKTYGRQMPVVVVGDDSGWDDWWSGAAMHKWREVIERFDAAGLLIPESERRK